MEEHRYVLPSNVYPSLNYLDAPRPRIPLTGSTGNAQYHTVAAANIYNDQKGLQLRPQPNFLLPTLPSQPAPSPHRTSLEARKSQIRSQRIYRGSKAKAIAESKQYQDYRSRQIKYGDEDQKWPDDLEELFLEALCLLPNMGRRKFSLNGKPHGRNELISLWLWLGHCESIPPGQPPDQSRHRKRKQVSSHIQVLKNFMRGHPAFDRLFPPKNAPRNGFEDSFKNDPSLRALAEGHLPYGRSSHHGFVSSMKYELLSPLPTPTRETSLSPDQQGQYQIPSVQSLRPSLFKMRMTTLRPGVDFKDFPEDDSEDGKPSTKVHTYSDSIPRAVGYSLLENFPDWRTRFPILAQMYSHNDLNCDVIHVEASLELRYGSLPERSELWGRFELLMPGEHHGQSIWRCTQSLHKPADLYGSSTSDLRFENVTSNPTVDRYEPGVGTHIRIRFPALSWAYALQRLSTLEAQFDEAVQTGVPLPTPTTARQYIDQVTMFQEIFSAAGPHQPFIRKAILLWTFKKCKAGEKGVATWRYLDPSPPRSSCFSPHPGSTHMASAVMSETFTAWASATAPSSHDSVPPHLQLPSSSSSLTTGTAPELPSLQPSPFDALSSFDGLPTTPSLHSMVASAAADLHFPFPAYGYPVASAENLSFMSHDTHDSDSTLVDVQNIGAGGGGSGAGDGGVHMDPFFSAASVLASFDHHGGGGGGGSSSLWDPSPTGVHSFESDAAFLAGYGAVSSSSAPEGVGGQIWDPVADAKGDEGWNVVVDGGRHESWEMVDDADLLAFEALARGE